MAKFQQTEKGDCWKSEATTEMSITLHMFSSIWGKEKQLHFGSTTHCQNRTGWRKDSDQKSDLVIFLQMLPDLLRFYSIVVLVLLFLYPAYNLFSRLVCL